MAEKKTKKTVKKKEEPKEKAAPKAKGPEKTIAELANQGKSPSEIGMVLRDTHGVGDIKKENGMQTVETQSKSDPKEWHKTHRTKDGKYICNCKGSQYGHECVHIKKLKEQNNDLGTPRLPYKDE